MRPAPKIKRPLLRWHGGKWLLAPKIVRFFPVHRTYTEAYGGAASVLLRKPPCYTEVWNDLDDGAWKLMRLIREGRGAELVELLRQTPFARREFELAYESVEDDLEMSRRLIVRSFMGFGSDGHNAALKTGFRADSNKSGTTPAKDWANYPDALTKICERIHGDGVVVEHRPALQVLRAHDRPDTLHYVDPPYMPESRSQKSRKGGLRYHCYEHEMMPECHEELLAGLRELVGMVVLSGYATELYDSMLPDWRRVELPALADGARERTEVLWINPAAAAKTPARLPAPRQVQTSFLEAHTPGAAGADLRKE